MSANALSHKGELRPPFDRFDGFCWRIGLDAAAFPGCDDPSDPSRSCIVLSEDGKDLGPPHTAHQIIARDGGGAFSHWCDNLYFSASDNSDPNSNARKYAVRIDVDKYFERRVEYSVGIIKSWAHRLPEGLGAFRERSVLEIGPGRDMGTALIMAALGARQVVAVDRFKGAWQEGWHDEFIRALRRALERMDGVSAPQILDEAIKARSLEVGPISFFAEPFEEAGKRFGSQADLSVSHSVFEHFYSMPEAATSLAAAMRRGARGVHNVDFRDHRNFGAPLEFLLIPDADYAQAECNDFYGRGNRVRPDAMRRMLVDAGFERVDFLPGETADADYLKEIETRLAAVQSSFRGMRAGDLRVLSGSFVVTR